MVGLWNVFQKIALGLEQVVKLGERNEDNHSESTIQQQLVNTTSSLSCNGTDESTCVQYRQNLKRSLSSSIEDAHPVKRRIIDNTEDNSTLKENLGEDQRRVERKYRKPTFLETVRRKRDLKIYTEKHSGPLVENYSKSLSKESKEPIPGVLFAANQSKPTPENQSAIESNLRLEILRRKEKSSLQEEINMLKKRIQQLQQDERRSVGLQAASDSSLLEQKLLRSTSKLLDKAVYHQEASQRNETYQRSEKGLLQLRSKSAIHKSRAIFFAEQVRKGLESIKITKTDEVIPAEKPLKRVETQKEKEPEPVIELSDSSEDELTDKLTDDSEYDIELYDDDLLSSEEVSVLNSSEGCLSAEEMNTYLSNGFDLPYADDEKNPLSTLSPKALTYCKLVLKHPKNRLLACRDGMKITRNDLRLLLPGNWLNDEIINFYMSLLQERNEKGVLENDYPKCLFLSSFFFSKLLSRGSYDYAAVRKWTRNMNVFEYDKILVPINIKNCHWILAVIDIERKRLVCLDSIGGYHVEKLKALLQWLCDEHRTRFGLDLADTYSFEQLDVPLQSNTDDCGVFCCKYAHYMSSNWALTFSAEDMTYFRWRMMLEILCQRVS